MTARCLLATHDSAHGPICVVASPTPESGLRVLRVFLPKPTVSAETLARRTYSDARAGSHPDLDSLLSRVDRFLSGEAVTFDLGMAALETCSPFQRRVLCAEHAIPRGWVSTYGRIADHLGRPGAARAVGSALAHNPYPILVPCHRAVRSDGTLGGYQGGVAMKRALLEMEGVQFTASGKVALENVYY